MVGGVKGVNFDIERELNGTLILKLDGVLLPDTWISNIRYFPASGRCELTLKRISTDNSATIEIISSKWKIDMSIPVDADDFVNNFVYSE